MLTKWRTRPGAGSWICLGLGVGLAAQAEAQSPAPRNPQVEIRVSTHATGTFEVTLTPQSMVDSTGGLSRMSIAKQFHGDLEGTSSGEMLAALTGVPGSAGYVAIERVSGILQGRRGTFVLQHSGSMARGAQHLMVTVVPDSGTDQLAGLTGTMLIIIADGRHSYDFEYTIGGPH